MTWRIHPAYLALGLALEVATVIAATSDVSILVIYAGICLTTGTLLLGWSHEDQRRRR